MGILVLALNFHFGAHAVIYRAREASVVFHWREFEPHTRLFHYMYGLSQRGFPTLVIVALWSQLLIATYVSLGIVASFISSSIAYFFCSHTWTLDLRITLLPFCDPSRGDFFMSGHPYAIRFSSHYTAYVPSMEHFHIPLVPYEWAHFVSPCAH